MHVGINAQLLSFSQNYRNGGISHHIRSLLTALAKCPGKHEYTVFVNGQDVIERLAARHPQITYVPVPWPEAQPTSRIAWEQFTLPSLIRQKHIDVLHSPANVLPELLPRDSAGVVTLHDLAFLRFPKVLTRSKRLYHRTFTMRSLQRATMIITVSESTKQDAIELAGIPARRLQTVYASIDERFSSKATEEEINAFRQKHELSQDFLLYLGTLEPRKNITTLIEAFAHLRRVYGRTEKLVLAGGKGWLYEAIYEKIAQLGLKGEVIFPGFVGESEQKLWYSAASAFVYPSLYEGFGLPVAEALACGTPVVTSNVSSLPEAGSDIALCVEPYSMEAIAEALYKALTDQTFRQRCRAMAVVAAQRFSAQAMAERTVVVYEQAAELHSSRRVSFV